MKAKVIPFNVAQAQGYNAAKERESNVIGARISEARKKRGMTLADLSGRLEGLGIKVSRAAASKWETGETVPNAYQLVAVFNALDMEDRLSFFMENYIPLLNEAGIRKVEEYKADLIASGKYRPAPRVASSIRYIEMPVSNLAVSAGTGAFLDEGNFEMVSFPEDKVPDGADFGIRVSGDSMEPVYHDGQIVWVQECEQIGIGQVGVFVYDNEGYLKVYNEQEPDESVVEEFTDSYGTVHPQPVMESYNQKYGPKVVRPTAVFQIVGRVL